MQWYGHPLSKQSALVDTETVSLSRGSYLHELSKLDMDTGELHEYILKPQLAVTSVEGKEKDDVKLASSGRDKHRLEKFDSPKDAIRRELELNTGKQLKDWDEVMSHLSSSPDDFFYTKLKEGVYPHLTGGKTPERDFSDWRVSKANLGVQSSMEELFAPGGEFVSSLKGKTIWGMNIGFDSKMIGAQLEAMRSDGLDVGIKHILETQNPHSPDPLYVTGEEVNKARAKAAWDGDWTRVWKAYLEHTPKEGETAVRDIQDVVRAFYSYGEKLGFLDKEDTKHGMSLEYTFRMFGALEEDPELRSSLTGMLEDHRSAEDIAKHSQYVLDRVLHYTSEAEKLYETGESALGERIASYFGRHKAHRSTLQGKSARKRLVRASEEIKKTGRTRQTTGVAPGWNIESETPSGEKATIPQPGRSYRYFSSVEEVASHLDDVGSYSSQNMGALAKELSETTDPKAFLNASVGDLDFDSVVDTSKPARTLLAGPEGKPGAFLFGISPKKMGVAAGTAALAVVAIGALSERRGDTAGDRGSLINQSYEDWRNGLQKGGVGEAQRRQYTDFGSPYQGPGTSFGALLDPEAMQAREEAIRGEYGGRTRTVNPFNRLKSSFRHNPGYRFNTDVVAVNKNPNTLRGQLVEADLRNYHIEVEDADTIKLREKGFLNNVKHFFGMQQEYSYRLAGIDAPETAHGKNAAQPHAEKSKRLLKDMLQMADNIQLFINPNDSTYGRQVGMLYADDKMVNHELVRRGLAAALPFGKWDESMVDYRPFLQLQDEAAKQGKGMWGTAYWQTYYRVSKATKETITFNTFARKESMADSMSQIRLLSEMQAAGEQGRMNQSEVEAISKSWRGQDYFSPEIFTWEATSKNQYDIHASNVQFNIDAGTKLNASPVRHRGDYGELSETQHAGMFASNNVWNRRQSQSYKKLEKQIRRQEMQREGLRSLRQNPIGHRNY